MNPIKLTPVKNKKSPKDKYVIIVSIMFGDADRYEDHKYSCKNEKDFIRVIKQLEDSPMSPGEGGDRKTYEKWELETFGSEDFIPYDDQCKAAYDTFEAFYYDSNGNKFKAESGNSIRGLDKCPQRG